MPILVFIKYYKIEEKLRQYLSKYSNCTKCSPSQKCSSLFSMFISNSIFFIIWVLKLLMAEKRKPFIHLSVLFSLYCKKLFYEACIKKRRAFSAYLIALFKDTSLRPESWLQCFKFTKWEGGWNWLLLIWCYSLPVVLNDILL